MQPSTKESRDATRLVEQSLLPQPLERSGSPTILSSEIASRKSSKSRWDSIPWKLEVLSWIGSLCFFLAIIIVLRIVNNRPSPDLEFGITPNAIVSLLATFAEALLAVPINSAIGQMKWLHALQKRPIDNFRAIDEATRGPIGSIQLLAHRKAGVTASFGAFVIIVALGISTFFQQTLKYHAIYLSNDNALMPIAQYMNGSGSAPVSGGGTTGGVDPELLAAPYLGLYSAANTNFSTTVDCGTGNCTWESYQTLSICNTCKNLTSTLNMTKVHVNASQKGLDTAYNTDYYMLQNGFGLTGIQPVDLTVATAVLNITTDWNQDYESIAFPNNGSKLLSVFAVGSAPGTLPSQPDANAIPDPMTGNIFAPPVAFECMLQMCIRNMRAEFINGTLTETEVSRWTNQSQPLRDNGVFILQSPTSATTFAATDLAIEGTSQWLSYLLVGNATMIDDNGHWDNSYPPMISSDLILAMYLAMNRSTTGFPDLMDNLANSLSRNLRTISYQPASIVGSAFYPTSQAVVTWEWLILPLFELIASLAFLIAVMVETRRRGLTPWTNNVLAYFFHGLDERPLGRHVQENQSIMKEEASKLLVEFKPHENGGGLAVMESNGVSQD